MKFVLKYIVSVMLLLAVQTAHSQQDSLRYNEFIAVVGKPSADSITLRWAPLNFTAWKNGNNNGYIVERYVIAKDGNLLSQPQKTILTASPLKPLPEDQWEQIVRTNRYAAIAAQALFGDRFEIDLTQSDVFSIVNKIRENEQRFTFSLFCADMSPLVAQASALWYTDKSIRKGEKYLYRIIVNSIDSLRGSIFISADDQYSLPKPRNLKADFKNKLASLRWDKSISGKYTAYTVERSTDGRSFNSISDAPLVTMSPTDVEDNRYEYAVDSLIDLTKTYYYRVKGVSPFGEESQPSDVVSGKGTVTITEVPYINEGENIENKLIRLEWQFPEENNSAIKGFRVERAFKPQGNFTNLTLQNPLSPETRSFDDKTAQQVNYYKVTALGLNGEQYHSPLYFAQLIDSIPPLAPTGLKATIDEFGSVELSWSQNIEHDIYGYRIYKGNYESEEFSQITTEPINNTSYTDKILLNTLNKSVFYQVMAIDINQNHSELSATLKVPLPDKVKPQPPVLLPLKSSDKGIAIPWIKSSSEDVVQYDVYRKATGRTEWQRIRMIKSTQDTIYTYFDSTTEAGIANHYTVTAIDDAGLESDPSSPVSALKLDNKLRAAVKWKEPAINNEKRLVKLSWGYDPNGVKSFTIYKAVDENSPVMYRTLTGDKREFDDMLQPGKQYKYRIMAIFENGFKSSLSEEISVKY